jgi:hypothetical protein
VKDGRPVMDERSRAMRDALDRVAQRGSNAPAQADLFQALNSGALFSDCRKYRYRLWRIWDGAKQPLCFIGLNPSDADEHYNDPTVTRMIERAHAYSLGGLIVVNVYALVSTDPQGLRGPLYPVGENGDDRTDIEILKAARESGLVICGWGTKAGKRGHELMRRLKAAGIVPHALKLNKDGSPCHPLYLSYELKPVALV